MIVTRKVYKQGHSNMVAIPPLMIQWIGLDPDSREVDIGLFQRNREKLLVIRAHHPASTRKARRRSRAR